MSAVSILRVSTYESISQWTYHVDTLCPSLCSVRTAVYTHYPQHFTPGYTTPTMTHCCSAGSAVVWPFHVTSPIYLTYDWPQWTLILFELSPVKCRKTGAHRGMWKCTWSYVRAAHTLHCIMHNILGHSRGLCTVVQDRHIPHMYVTGASLSLETAQELSRVLGEHTHTLEQLNCSTETSEVTKYIVHYAM